MLHNNNTMSIIILIIGYCSKNYPNTLLGTHLFSDKFLIDFLYVSYKFCFFIFQSSFDYTELCPGGSATATTVVLESGAVIHHPPLQLQLQQGHTQTQVPRSALVSSGTTTPNPNPNPPRSRPWHDFGRQNDADKIQIAKL